MSMDTAVITNKPLLNNNSLKVTFSPRAIHLHTYCKEVTNDLCYHTAEAYDLLGERRHDGSCEETVSDKVLTHGHCPLAHLLSSSTV